MAYMFPIAMGTFCLTVHSCMLLWPYKTKGKKKNVVLVKQYFYTQTPCCLCIETAFLMFNPLTLYLSWWAKKDSKQSMPLSTGSAALVRHFDHFCLYFFIRYACETTQVIVIVYTNVRNKIGRHAFVIVTKWNVAYSLCSQSLALVFQGNRVMPHVNTTVTF